MSGSMHEDGRALRAPSSAICSAAGEGGAGGDADEDAFLLRQLHRLPSSRPAPAMVSIWSISFSVTASVVSLGMKSGAQPWNGCGLHTPDGCPSARCVGAALLRLHRWSASARRSGSATMILVFGTPWRSTRPTPFRVPPVPKPVTQ